MEPQMAFEPPPPPQPPPPETAKEPRPGLFDMLDGLPAHILVVAGLALTLLIPLILGIKNASVGGSREELGRALNLVELDVQQYKEELDKKKRSRDDRATAQQDFDKAQQAKESAEVKVRSLESDKASLATSDMPPELKQSQMTDLQRRITTAQTEASTAQGDMDRAQRRLDSMPKDDKPDPNQETLDERRRRAESENNVIELKKAYLDAQVSQAGTVSHHVLGWLGRLLLLVGLLVMTVQSQGLRQKILLLVLLVVMFSALSGVNLNFAAQGNMGESPRDVERITAPPPPASNK